MSDIAIMLIGIATIINSINLFQTAKRLKEDEDAIVRLLKGADDETD